MDVWREVASMERKNEPIFKRIQADEKAARLLYKQRYKLTYDPQEVEALIAKGIAHVDQNDLDSAQKNFERARELNPRNFRVVQNLGAIAETKNQLDQAMARYREAISLAPQYDGLYYNFAFVLEKMHLAPMLVLCTTNSKN